MKVKVRDYTTADRKAVALALESLQDHLVRLDPWHRVAKGRNYGAKAVAHRLREVRRNHGFILVAESHGMPLGVVVGWIRPFTAMDRMEDLPTRQGFIPDLAVLPDWRGKGVGTKLLDAAERRFRQANCDQIGLGVFPPNRGARRLYRRKGYSVRGIWLVKQTGRPLSRWPPASKKKRVHPRARASSS